MLKLVKVWHDSCRFYTYLYHKSRPENSVLLGTQRFRLLRSRRFRYVVETPDSSKHINLWRQSVTFATKLNKRVNSHKMQDIKQTPWCMNCSHVMQLINTIRHKRQAVNVRKARRSVLVFHFGLIARFTYMYLFITTASICWLQDFYVLLVSVSRRHAAINGGCTLSILMSVFNWSIFCIKRFFACLCYAYWTLVTMTMMQIKS